MRFVFTVLKNQLLVYEGPIEKRAQAKFNKQCERIPVDGTKYVVAKDDRELYDGIDFMAARRKLANKIEELFNSRGSTSTVTFQVQNGETTVTYSVRPFEERICGGDPQHSI